MVFFDWLLILGMMFFKVLPVLQCLSVLRSSWWQEA